jgi:hypothetical protein
MRAGSWAKNGASATAHVYTKAALYNLLLCAYFLAGSASGRGLPLPGNSHSTAGTCMNRGRSSYILVISLSCVVRCAQGLLTRGVLTRGCYRGHVNEATTGKAKHPSMHSKHQCRHSMANSVYMYNQWGRGQLWDCSSTHLELFLVLQGRPLVRVIGQTPMHNITYYCQRLV